MDAFFDAWQPQLEKHDATLIVVNDGDDPTAQFRFHRRVMSIPMSPCSLLGDYADVVYRHSDVVRNLGFACVAKAMPEAEVVLTVDDDTSPEGDTIGDHLAVLQKRCSVSWVSTCNYPPRGLPYGVRQEAEIVLSHGSWTGCPDVDAPTQLVAGTDGYKRNMGPIPKGCLFPCSAMNLAFKRCLLPWIYQAPMGPQTGYPLDRFGDIWAGITAKHEIDRKGWAAVTGFSAVRHERASDVFENLKKEALGIQLNETCWNNEKLTPQTVHPYFALYMEKLQRWQEFLRTCG